MTKQKPLAIDDVPDRLFDIASLLDIGTWCVKLRSLIAEITAGLARLYTASHYPDGMPIRPMDQPIAEAKLRKAARRCDDKVIGGLLSLTSQIGELHHVQ